jgi:small multidrug resistance pump
MMAYLFLMAAIATEVAGTSLLKTTDGFSRLIPTVVCLTAYAISFAFMAQAVKHVPVGILYALWSGIGTAAIVCIGVAFLGQSINAMSIVGIGVIVAGVVVVNLGGVY